MRTPAARDYTPCSACIRFCSELAALSEIASEFIALRREKAALADLARLEATLQRYERHIARDHPCRGGNVPRAMRHARRAA